MTATDVTLPDVLLRICADTRAEVERRRATTSPDAIRSQIAAIGPTRGFGRAVMDRAATGFALIAEIKKASPSGGLIRPEFDPPALARAYQEAGATCLSVLTDGPHFQGAPEHLREARAAVPLPVLRKDFMIDPWQIGESRAMGADCVLLIMAALTDDQARRMEELADSLDMDVLVEVHDEAELERALCLNTRLIGINNRNLRTLVTDVETSVALSSQVPADRFVIAESGLRTHDDLQRLSRSGVNSFLVGESLLRHDDVTQATRTLLHG